MSARAWLFGPDAVLDKISEWHLSCYWSKSDTWYRPAGRLGVGAVFPSGADTGTLSGALARFAMSVIIARPIDLLAATSLVEHDNGNAAPGDQGNPGEGQSVRQIAPDD